MIGLFHARSSTVLSRTCALVTNSQYRGYLCPSWKASFLHSCPRTVNSGLLLTRFQVQWYSSKKSGGVSSRTRKNTKLISSSHKQKTDPEPLMKVDKEAFFVVRKGDVIGVYKNISDCQAQAGTSICDRPVSVYKGYSMRKDTEKHLVSCGLKNALYTIRASDFTIDLFGTLVPCPLQPPSSRDELPSEPETKKRSQKASSFGQSCILEFDGASKGNPGQAGAGAVIRSDDGTLICRVRQGLGTTTNNVAEYQALILGLKYALGKGFTEVRARGDSKLVCMQVKGQWKARAQHISVLWKEAKKWKDKFASVQIMHVLRGLNSEADAQANLAVHLAEGEVQEEETMNDSGGHGVCEN